MRRSIIDRMAMASDDIQEQDKGTEQGPEQKSCLGNGPTIGQGTYIKDRSPGSDSNANFPSRTLLIIWFVSTNDSRTNFGFRISGGGMVAVQAPCQSGTAVIGAVCRKGPTGRILGFRVCGVGGNLSMQKAKQ